MDGCSKAKEGKARAEGCGTSAVAEEAKVEDPCVADAVFSSREAAEVRSKLLKLKTLWRRLRLESKKRLLS